MNTKAVSISTSLSSAASCFTIFFTAVLFYLLFGHLLPITDPVESNYALTAKEMVLTSDWLSPKIYGNVWFDKPVFFYWLTAASFKLLGFSDLAARLNPAIFAAFGLVLVYWFMSKVTSPRIAFLAMIILGTSLEYVVLAKLVITDMVFFFFNSTALVCFYLGYIKSNESKRWYLSMYASMALAVLTKGPIGLLLPGLIIAVFITMQRNWAILREMSLLSGSILFALITLPWYITMYGLYGSEFINTFLGVHNYLRATVSEHPKDNVSYYYLAVYLLSMLPWSFLALKALVRGVQEQRQNYSPLMTFALIWVLGYFGFYSLMATKYVTYTFPILFPISIITAIYLNQLFVQNKAKVIIYWVGIPFSCLMLAYILLAFRFLADISLVVTVIGLLAILFFTWCQAKGRQAKWLFEMICLGQITACILLSAVVFPELAESRSGRDIAEFIAENQNYRVGMYQFYSASSVYYSGHIAVKLLSSTAMAANQSETLDWSSKYTMPTQTLAEFMAQSQEKNTLVVVPDKVKAQFLAEYQALSPRLQQSSDGLNYYNLN